MPLRKSQSIPPTYGQPKTPRVVGLCSERSEGKGDLAAAQAIAAQYPTSERRSAGRTRSVVLGSRAAKRLPDRATKATADAE